MARTPRVLHNCMPRWAPALHNDILMRTTNLQPRTPDKLNSRSEPEIVKSTITASIKSDTRNDNDNHSFGCITRRPCGNCFSLGSKFAE
eukprot:4201693-Lingulodinium_polyedra.AAC.1